MILLSFIFLNGGFPISTASGYQDYPVVAAGTDGYLVVWEDERSGISNIWGQRVAEDGTLIDTNFAISVSDSTQKWVDVAFGDSAFLVVWLDKKDYNLWGQLLTSTAALIDTPFQVCSTEFVDWNPAIAWGRNRWLVVWNWGGIWGQFLTPDGALEGERFEVYKNSKGKSGNADAAAFDGENFLVAWNEASLHPRRVVEGQMIDSTGAKIDTHFTVVSASAPMMYPKIACSGTEYLVISDVGDDSIGAQFVGLDGSLTGELIVIADEPRGYNRWRPAVAWEGANYLAVWVDGRYDEHAIYGRWISREGDFLDTSFAISTAWWSYEYEPEIACGETGCLVVWLDTRHLDHDVYGRIVSSTGVEESNEQLSISNSQLTVHPNPFTHNTVVEFVDEKTRHVMSLQIHDLSGRLVKSFPITKSPNQQIIKLSWDAHNVPAGIYFLEFRDRNIVKRQKLVKMEVKR
jgi:hypothetical protein